MFVLGAVLHIHHRDIVCIQGRIVTLEEKERLQSSKTNGVSNQGIEHNLLLSVYMWTCTIIIYTCSEISGVLIKYIHVYVYVSADLHLDIMQRGVQ